MIAVRNVPTSRGEARLELRRPRGAAALVLLLHGAGSGTSAPVLQALAAALADRRYAVALLDQPYRVAGRRAPDPAPTLDAVVREVAATLPDLPLVLAGRSSGARVACRVAADLAARGVVALGFPLRPPGRDVTRAGELDAAGCPVVVLQGERDAFGSPDDVGRACPRVRVVAVPGDHAMRRHAGEIAAAAADAVRSLVPQSLTT
jgi:predicted alpha/beta-hydrolase family hydrolase